MRDRNKILEIIPSHFSKEQILPFVLEKFYDIDDIEDRYTLLEHGWSLCELPKHSMSHVTLMNILKNDGDEYHHMMNEEEKKTLNELPKIVKVYRGVLVPYYKTPITDSNCHGDHLDRGISWTINKDKGLWFGKRYKSLKTFKDWTPYLLESEIEKRYIYCYLNSRKEDEVIIDPSWFDKEIKVTRIK